MDKTIKPINISELTNKYLPQAAAKTLQAILENNQLSAEAKWQQAQTLLSPQQPFSLHETIYQAIYALSDPIHNPGPMVYPSQQTIQNANLTQLMAAKGITSYRALHQWSCQHYEDFWALMLKTLNIRLDTPYTHLCDITKGLETPEWLSGTTLNIANSCFLANPDKIAIVYQTAPGQPLQEITYRQLDRLSNRIANGLQALGWKIGDAIAIDMPMTVEAVAAYLGIVKAGMTVVAIADSFAANEIATRLTIAKAKGIITQDAITRNHKVLPLYEKVQQANAPMAIVLQEMSSQTSISLRAGDILWQDFLSNHDEFKAISCDPNGSINILFSSGTTGDPKAIPWDHTSPIKAAADAYCHHDIKPSDIFAWPTNLGWMMGPWLIFACFINRASMALFYGAPNTQAFCQFIEASQTTILGVVPSLVRIWRDNRWLENVHWEHIRCFSSTGESSNAHDMLFLSSRANYAPVIEYCGGTEIAGGYITSTVIEKNIPGLFSTPALGVNFDLLDDKQQPANKGEVALIPPSIGLSRHLLNQDHYLVYFQGMPKKNQTLYRRHGDELEQLANGYYRALGRADDTMNIGGIKVSAAEIENAIANIPGIHESAAIAIPEKAGGLCEIVIYSVPSYPGQDEKITQQIMQKAISTQLNPLFKIKEVKFIEALPRTSSNKIMRRVLRDQYCAR